MSKTNEEIARTIMYDDKQAPVKKPPKGVNIQSTSNVVIMESGGMRHQVPSITAFSTLAREYEKTRNDLRQSRVDIKKLTETIKKMDAALRLVERELENKADKYVDD